jgi:hypothetical protein
MQSLRMIRACGYPDEQRGDVMELFTREEAIKQAKAAYAQASRPEPSDEQALDDFLVVNWGHWVEVDLYLSS